MKNIKMLAGAATVCAILAFSGTPTMAQDIFTVSGVHVDERAETAAAAREQALLVGQRQAFEEVVARLTLPEDRQSLAMPGAAELANMVRDFGVSNEKTSSVRYIADMTVRFKDNAVRNYLRFRDVSFAELQSKPVVILPIYRTQSYMNLWDDPNPWRDVWSRNVASSGLVPVKMPIGDLSDIGTISAEQAESGAMERLAELAKRYGANTAVVATAEVSGPKGGETVNVSVTRYDPSGSPQVFGVREKTQSGQSLSQTLVRAAKSVQTKLSEGWKRANLINFSTGGTLMVFVPITGLSDWADIEEKVTSLPVVRNARVVAMSRREVQLSLEFVGSNSQLKTALNQKNLNLTQMGQLWFIQPVGTDRLEGLSLNN
ncbi:DUF2066 domain-containing protein [Thalassospira lucentensis]|nr:DUF2066 domain-containing protein [Thalassospira lucentensis]